ncbi:MAG: SIR2 family protein, partial [Candidatus Tectomicrobia bacterium]|nr:SIR2 family protein [Candidatus Tectomicrobia bacterium]
MRFFANGPLIPNEPLQLRDQGEVVFFCGAGISMPAGLPSFFGLTKAMITKLGVPETSKSHILFERVVNETDPEFAPPLDQVLGLLQREYTPSRIEAEVATQLKTPRKANVYYHDIVLRLSSDVEQKSFVVTTNFDLLFERARKGLQRWAPPMLPDMSGDQNHHGIVYLHGRLSQAKSETFGTQGLVLGSGDFGRGYLADGWATRFFRQLLERRVVVLLGYSAGDPPVRYLLEGLHASTSAKLRTIYAFDRGEASEVRAKWRDLGITGIPYDTYDQLWQTLSVWAQ